MSKWKCDICKKDFDNFHAQGFDNKIYCPLCFFKEDNRRLQQRLDKEIENWNTLKRHFEFLKINTTGGNKEFMEDILEIMNALEGGNNEN